MAEITVCGYVKTSTEVSFGELHEIQRILKDCEEDYLYVTGNVSGSRGAVPPRTLMNVDGELDDIDSIDLLIDAISSIEGVNEGEIKYESQLTGEVWRHKFDPNRSEWVKESAKLVFESEQPKYLVVRLGDDGACLSNNAGVGAYATLDDAREGLRRDVIACMQAAGIPEKEIEDSEGTNWWVDEDRLNAICDFPEVGCEWRALPVPETERTREGLVDVDKTLDELRRRDDSPTMDHDRG